MLNVVMLNVVRMNVVRLNVIMMNVEVLNVVMLNVVMLNVVMLNVVRLNVVMLGVVLPILTPLLNRKLLFVFLPFSSKREKKLFKGKSRKVTINPRAKLFMATNNTPSSKLACLSLPGVFTLV